jgi:hypothetical protein
MDGRKKMLTTTNTPLEVATNHGFIQGDRCPSHPPWLRPPEKKEKEKPYLVADLAKEIRRPSSTYGHDA